MTTTAHRILALWQDLPEWRATQEDIQRSLKSRGAARHHVRQALGNLVREGALAKSGEHYRLPQPQAAQAPAGRRAAEEPRLMGTFTAHPDGYGFIWVADLRESLFIPPRENLGALDGDWVAVQKVPGRDQRTSGRITAVLERRRLRARGTVELERGRAWVVPLNLRVPDILIEPQAGDPAYGPGSVVDVALTAFPSHADEAPAGRITGLAPEGDAPDQLIDSILANSTLHLGFSRATETQLSRAGAGDILAQARREGRADLTGLPFVTVDPENARDFDDAVYLDRSAAGNERLWVAIADVAAYVPAGSPLDDDAFAKGTSVYFPARVLPMLPELLSNDLCSLRPDEPRLAMVVEMELLADGAVAAAKFHEAVIRSHARLSYDQVQGVFDDLPGAWAADAGIRAMLLRMKGVAEALRRKRDGRGAVSFVFPEVRFELDGNGLPARILRKYPSDATRLIEQFMLEANECVAKLCAEEGLPALYRVHDPPPEDQLPQVVQQLWNNRVQTNLAALRTPRGFNGAIAQLAGHPARESLELVLLKAMAQAQYREGSEPHFALAAEHYCHFTSPIRRYPDLVVHRALKDWLHRGEGAPRPPGRPDAGMYLSARERLAADVEGQVARLYRVLYLEPHLGEEFPATVVSVAERGLGIALRDEFVEGFLPMEALTDDAYRFDRERQALVGRNRRQVIAFGQRLVAQLVRADRMAQKLDFALKRWSWEPAAGGKPVGAKPGSRHGAKTGRSPAQKVAAGQGRAADAASDAASFAKGNRRAGHNAGSGRPAKSGRSSGAPASEAPPAAGKSRAPAKGRRS